jgi:RNA polymerase sigma-70 factor (ECF subfamily)
MIAGAGAEKVPAAQRKMSSRLLFLGRNGTAMHHQPEDDLLAGLVQGRQDAFAALYDRYGRPLYRVAWTLLRSRQDAEDAVQEVFLGLVRARAALGQVENLRAYLFSALRHAVARQGARRKTAPLPPEDPPAREVYTGGDVDPETFRLLEVGLAALPAPQREVVTLKIDGGLTFAEVAALLGVRPKTAASRYRYALEKLRAILDAGRHEPRNTPTGLA